MNIWLAGKWGRDFAYRIVREEFRVHSVFRSVCNLQAAPDQPLLSLVSKQEAMGPNALFIDGARFEGTLGLAHPLTFADGALHCGPVAINCRNITAWEPEAGVYTPGGQAWQQAAKWLEAQAPGLGSMQSDKAQELAAGLLAEHDSRVRSALESFIGYGEGLTPSGDDFIAGVLLAYVRGRGLAGSRVQEQANPGNWVYEQSGPESWLNEQGEFARGFHEQSGSDSGFLRELPALVERLLGRTNSISGTMLWYAARGEGAAYVTDMADAIYADSKQTIDYAYRLWHIGASSGRYLLAGVLAGCRIIETREQGSIQTWKKKSW